MYRLKMREVKLQKSQLIHTDLNGPHRTTGSGGESFVRSFIDDYSKCS